MNFSLLYIKHMVISSFQKKKTLQLCSVASRNRLICKRHVYYFGDSKLFFKKLSFIEKLKIKIDEIAKFVFQKCILRKIFDHVCFYSSSVHFVARQT